MEHELRKHIHNILGSMANKKISIWHKLGEIFIEMIIIVFAVFFAVSIERQREHSHEQKEVKEFLIGLRQDLTNDIKEMEDDVASYKKHGKWLTHFALEKQLNYDTVNRYKYAISSMVGLLPNSGRYEGFKASGKMNTIENAELRTSILDFYQEVLVALTNNTTIYTNLKRNFETLIFQRERFTSDSTTNIVDVLKDPVINNYTRRLMYVKEILGRYQKAIDHSQKIIDLINEEYP